MSRFIKRLQVRFKFNVTSYGAMTLSGVSRLCFAYTIDLSFPCASTCARSFWNHGVMHWSLRAFRWKAMSKFLDDGSGLLFLPLLVEDHGQDLPTPTIPNQTHKHHLHSSSCPGAF